MFLTSMIIVLNCNQNMCLLVSMFALNVLLSVMFIMEMGSISEMLCLFIYTFTQNKLL